MNFLSQISGKSKRHSILFAEAPISTPAHKTKKETNSGRSYTGGSAKHAKKQEEEDDSQGKYGVRKPRRDSSKKRHSMILDSEVIIPKNLQTHTLEPFAEEDTFSAVPKKLPELRLPSTNTDSMLKDSNVYKSDAFIMVKDNSFSGYISSTDVFSDQSQNHNISDKNLHNISPLKSKCHRTSLYFN